VNENLALAFAALSTAVVSDALDRFGISGQAEGIKRLSGGGVVAGPAFTVRYGMTGLSGGTVGDYIDDVPPGSVVVLDNAARTVGTVWGGLLSETAHRRGIVATAIDGLCRDVTRAEELSYQLYSRDCWMRTGKDRVKLEALQDPVTLGGVRVEPRDIVVGDRDGIVVVPAVRASQILEAAQQIDEAEQRIRQRVAEGLQLHAAREEAGYFRLQSRRT
jgi:4-hydroxy-4-methyl-2-oxoglutarate aldolase